ncbi:FliG C-terminal domain-containing protein [Jannaschia formosa]|uniref:FliG C-terminal domain-containing protein n=1 Tax=Jannaschia formosa TaxID=2259592 RepID=UPI000E1BED8D|nr:FliG C-terminal domain-containing protein [Jannaschia formosa]TFL16968.1 flagellar motor switch protein FliG [Jannaschia formosa]
MSHLPSFPDQPRAGGLTRGQKAAVVVRLLMMGGADPGLSRLPRDQQRRLVREMASLRFVDRQTLAETVAEFSAELDGIGLHFPREVDRVLQALDGALSQDVVDALLSETGGDPALVGGAAWTAISAMEATALTSLLEGETDEVCAIVVSKLHPDRAAALLAAFAPDRADAIASALARTEAVPPDAVARIGTSLSRSSAGRVRGAFDANAVVRIAAILNVSTTRLRQNVLARLEEGDPDFAARVRAAIFTWESIPERLDPRDLPKVLRGIETPLVVTALAGPEDEVSAFMLGSMSGRMAGQMREQIDETPTPVQDAIDEARGKIVQEIRRLEDEGDISLIAAKR